MMISNKTKTTWVLAMATIAATAYASSEVLPTRRASYRDLDLTRREGAPVLYQRINFAAREVCEPAIGWQQFMAAKVRACREQALARRSAPLRGTLYCTSSVTTPPRMGQW